MNKIILSILLILSNLAFSQPYNNAIGGKLGYGLLGSYKIFLAEKSALDVFAGFTWLGNGINLGVNYNHQLPLSKELKSLYWYFGGGLSLSTFSWGSNYKNNTVTTNSGVILAISGNIGIEYGFKDFPITIGIEYMPTIALNRDYYYGSRFGGGFGSLIVRYKLRN